MTIEKLFLLVSPNNYFIFNTKYNANNNAGNTLHATSTYIYILYMPPTCTNQHTKKKIK